MNDLKNSLFSVFEHIWFPSAAQFAVSNFAYLFLVFMFTVCWILLNSLCCNVVNIVIAVMQDHTTFQQLMTRVASWEISVEKFP